MLLSKKFAEADVTEGSTASINDDEDLARMGYKSEFKREFTNLGTISFAFSIMCVFSLLLAEMTLMPRQSGEYARLFRRLSIRPWFMAEDRLP